MIDEYLSRVATPPTLLQEGDIPQQFADLGEWNEWVVGHFSNEEAQNAIQAANEYLASHTLDGSAINLH